MNEGGSQHGLAEALPYTEGLWMQASHALLGEAQLVKSLLGESYLTWVRVHSIGL